MTPRRKPRPPGPGSHCTGRTPATETVESGSEPAVHGDSAASPANQVVRVAVPAPLRQTFDYRLPAPDRSGCREPGARVIVPFGRRRLVGVITAVGGSGDLDEDRLRTVFALADAHGPSLPRSLLDLCLWAADYYHAPIGEVLHAVLPPPLRKPPATASQVRNPRWQLVAGDDAPEIPSRAHRQHEALRLLREKGPLTTAELAVMGISATVLRGLRERGAIVPGEPADAPAGPVIPTPPPSGDAPAPNAAQQAAIRAVLAATHEFGCFLLDGVTGSGKTEVYLRIIAEVIAAGRQALVLVPEISLTPQTVSRFADRFGPGAVTVMHSGLSAGERMNAWNGLSGGAASVLIGTRSAVFTPMRNPGVLIVDEEHDSSFKQQDGFRYSARDVAVIRGKLEGFPVLLGSATPSLESLHNVSRGRYTHLILPERAGPASHPVAHLEDVRGMGLNAGLSPPLITRIRANLAAGGQVLVFINRRGYAPVLMCHECGWTADCDGCNTRMTLHRANSALRCHHCGGTARAPRTCPACASAALLPLGAGTQRTEQALTELFPGTPVIRIDRDSTRRRGVHDELSEFMQTGQPCILVGTQMLAKGHHFPGVTLVAILDADTGFMSSDFRGLEKTGQLICQVAGRAGRGSGGGEVFLQTCQPGHPALAPLLAWDYAGFARALMEEREAARLPPFASLCVFRAEAASTDQAMAFLSAAAGTAGAGNDPEVELWGPMPSPMEKRAGRYRAQFVLCSCNRPRIQRLAAAVCRTIEAQPARRDLRWSVDIDPVDLY